MREVLAILNDRAEAVSALSELREAILGPIQKDERQIFKALTRLELIEEAREGWAGYEKRQAKEELRAIRQTLSA